MLRRRCGGWPKHHDAKHEELKHAWARASEIAETLDDRRMEGRLSVWWGSHLTLYQPDAGIELLSGARDRCDGVGDRFWAAYAEGALALGRVFQGRDDLASEHLHAMAARQLVHPSTRLQVDELTRHVVVDFALGRYDAVREVADAVARGLDGTASPRRISASQPSSSKGAPTPRSRTRCSWVARLSRPTCHRSCASWDWPTAPRSRRRSPRGRKPELSPR